MWALSKSLGTTVDGMPFIEGWYPRVSWNELNVRNPEKKVEIKTALLSTRYEFWDENSLRILEMILLTVCILRSTIPVFRCARVGRGLNVMLCATNIPRSFLAFYSLSAENDTEAPCRIIQQFSNELQIVSVSFFVVTVISANEVSISFITNNVRLAPSIC